MNYESRVKKLEATMIATKSDYCQCPVRASVFVRDLELTDQEHAELDARIHAAANPNQSVYCGECSKELERAAPTIVVEIVGAPGSIGLPADAFTTGAH